MLVLFNKPYGVVSQFTSDGSNTHRTLAGFGLPAGVYAAGRLDHDSEGLLLLTDDGRLAARITQPASGHWKTYLAQVEGTPAEEQLQALRAGVRLKDGMTRPARATLAEPQPDFWPRNPPIRVRKSVPDCWISLQIAEGRNRQVRRMTAAVGLPTLRLVRTQVWKWQLGDLAPGQWRLVDAART
ncbi:pseudouridine synthase [Pseudoxanthomonas dokdonensis]|uniref:Pseudouridine synthase n=1 Tax=Pseudoxanthomonas dokdonensis TaxID=344882 RepID=A0A0R0D146_9GAMM|nr:pseudouridine synthase [Pseudoxanthomonas dokdonensis]KRG72087.1 pseudouridine synthase [Pseudoxanthomonas dokdonensis]